MRSRSIASSPLSVLAFIALVALSLAGCAAGTGAPGPSRGGRAAQAPPKAELPKEITIALRLSAGDSWKSRYVSTSEARRTLVGADGKAAVKTRSAGMEIVATQKVLAVEGTVARIEIAESDVRILQDGKFIPAPFKQFNPPVPVVFTLDTASGKADFSGVRKAYEEWMALVKDGPAGDILGKTFRLAGYLAAVEDMYVKPFTRVAGRKLSGEETSAGKDVVLPFLGHGAGLVPVPVAGSMRYTGFSVADGRHLLAVEGRYEGRIVTAPQEDLEAIVAEFGVKASGQFRGYGEAKGRFASSVDALSGREVRSTNRLTYNAEWLFGGSKLLEEISGISTLEKIE